jgi:hypothetical protein
MRYHGAGAAALHTARRLGRRVIGQETGPGALRRVVLGRGDNELAGRVEGVGVPTGLEPTSAGRCDSITTAAVDRLTPRTAPVIAQCQQ